MDLPQNIGSIKLQGGNYALTDKFILKLHTFSNHFRNFLLVASALFLGLWMYNIPYKENPTYIDLSKLNTFDGLFWVALVSLGLVSLFYVGDELGSSGIKQKSNLLFLFVSLILTLAIFMSKNNLTSANGQAQIQTIFYEFLLFLVLDAIFVILLWRSDEADVEYDKPLLLIINLLQVILAIIILFLLGFDKTF